MEYVIANIGYFLEMLMIQIYAELIWKKKFCFRCFSCALFVVNGAILTGVNLGVFPGLSVLIVHISLYTYLWTGFKGNIREKIARTCETFVLAWGTEMVSGIVLSLVIYKLKEYAVVLVLANSMSVLISIVLSVIVRRRKNTLEKIRYYTSIKSLIVCFLPLFVILVAYTVKHEFYVWYNLFITIYMVVVFWYLRKVHKAECAIQQKEMELKINCVYGGLYEDVLDIIRRKQHNYKNQLAAIYSTHKTAQSLNELIQMQREYCDMLQEDSQFEFIMMSCREPILAGFIYYKCVEGLNQNINVDCKISINQWNCKVKLYELIEMLGIFFNNAFEYVNENKNVGREVYFMCIEETELYTISIENEIAVDSRINFNRMFEMGYSTKGKERGLGLPRIKEICDFYKLNIRVSVENCENKKLKFLISIPK